MTSPSPKRILIVEDSPDLQFLLSQLFKTEGYSTWQAYNGQQALEILNSSTELPAVIFLDIMMPVMDGFEFRQKQRANPRLAMIPVVVMTADSNSQAKAQSLGNEVISKPIVDIDQLLAVAKRLIS